MPAHDGAMTSAQFRMAKAALGLSNPDVAALTGLHKNTLNRADHGTATNATWALIRLKLEGEGVEFIDDDGRAPGVCYAPPDQSD